MRQNSSVLSSDFFITHQVRVLVNQGHGTTNKVLVNQGHDTTKIALITNFELRPPWSDGIRVLQEGWLIQLQEPAMPTLQLAILIVSEKTVTTIMHILLQLTSIDLHPDYY